MSCIYNRFIDIIEKKTKSKNKLAWWWKRISSFEIPLAPCVSFFFSFIFRKYLLSTGAKTRAEKEIHFVHNSFGQLVVCLFVVVVVGEATCCVIASVGLPIHELMTILYPLLSSNAHRNATTNFVNLCIYVSGWAWDIADIISKWVVKSLAGTSHVVIFSAASSFSVEPKEKKEKILLCAFWNYSPVCSFCRARVCVSCSANISAVFIFAFIPSTYAFFFHS